MLRHDRRLTWAILGWGVLALASSLSGCVDAVPQDVVQAVEKIDRDLTELGADEVSPAAYAEFAQQWMVLKVRAQADEDLIRWRWEPNDLEMALRRLQEEGARTVDRLTKERESLRRSAGHQIVLGEDRFRMETLQVSAIDGGILLRRPPNEIERLITQGHSVYRRDRYGLPLHAPGQPAQTAMMSNESRQYPDHNRISR